MFPFWLFGMGNPFIEKKEAVVNNFQDSLKYLTVEALKALPQESKFGILTGIGCALKNNSNNGAKTFQFHSDHLQKLQEIYILDKNSGFVDPTVIQDIYKDKKTLDEILQSNSPVIAESSSEDEIMNDLNLKYNLLETTAPVNSDEEKE